MLILCRNSMHNNAAVSELMEFLQSQYSKLPLLVRASSPADWSCIKAKLPKRWIECLPKELSTTQVRILLHFLGQLNFLPYPGLWYYFARSAKVAGRTGKIYTFHWRPGGREERRGERTGEERRKEECSFFHWIKTDTGNGVAGPITSTRYMHGIFPHFEVSITVIKANGKEVSDANHI